jgi:TonB family protein
MTKHPLWLSAAFAFTSTPLLAQDNGAAEAVEAAARDAAEAAMEVEVETQSTEPLPIEIEPAPPPIIVPQYPREPEYPTKPRTKSGFYRIIKPVDYPIEAWNADQEGRVKYELAVDDTGKPTGCTIKESSGHALLDQATCDLMLERAMFVPAYAAQDEPISSTYSGGYNWRKREPNMPAMGAPFQYLHDEKGVSSQCEFLRLENAPEELREQIERDIERGKKCPGPTGRQGVPYRDENGVPIAKLVTITMDVVLEDPPTAEQE